MTCGRRSRSRTLGALVPILAFALTPNAAAQQEGQRPVAATPQAETGSPEIPAGWSMAPSIGVSQFWDANPTLKGSGDSPTGDFVTSVRPGMAFGFRGKRTLLRTDYAGTIDYYNSLNELNTQDHRAGLDFSHQVNRRIKISARDQAMVSPTTGEAAEVTATVLRRQTTRMNAFRGGFDASLGPRTTLGGAYATQWIDFERDDNPLSPLLQGGHSHGGSGELRHRLTSRLSLGGDYDAQRAILAGGTRTFDVQSALGTVEFVMSQGLSATVGYGHAWLFTSDGMRRNGPAFDVGLDWRRPRTIGTVHYRRAFLPSFGFGGTFQNQELGASLQATLSRGLRWSGGASYSNNDPLVPGDPTLRTVSTRTSLGWVVKRRLQFDLFALHIAQNSQLAGGRVNRTRAGVQATVTEVMRAPR